MHFPPPVPVSYLFTDSKYSLRRTGRSPGCRPKGRQPRDSEAPSAPGPGRLRLALPYPSWGPTAPPLLLPHPLAFTPSPRLASPHRCRLGRGRAATAGRGEASGAAAAPRRQPGRCSRTAQELPQGPRLRSGPSGPARAPRLGDLAQPAPSISSEEDGVRGPARWDGWSWEPSLSLSVSLVIVARRETGGGGKWV